jgi:hypothetical protein
MVCQHTLKRFNFTKGKSTSNLQTGCCASLRKFDYTAVISLKPNVRNSAPERASKKSK